MGSPAYEKDNPFTRAAAMTRQLNIERGARIHDHISIDQPVRVRSSAMVEPPPLSLEEKEERDRKARDLGLPEFQTEDDGSGYTREEAEEAGKPVSPRAVFTELEARKESLAPTPSLITAAGSRPRLIDFKKVEGIDLVQGKAYVDGFEIEVPEEVVKNMKGYVIELAVSFVTVQLAAALADLGVVTGGTIDNPTTETTVVQEKSDTDTSTAKEVQADNSGEKNEAQELPQPSP